jgi:hypothetical protein
LGIELRGSGLVPCHLSHIPSPHPQNAVQIYRWTDCQTIWRAWAGDSDTAQERSQVLRQSCHPSATMPIPPRWTHLLVQLFAGPVRDSGEKEDSVIVITYNYL